VSPRKLALTVFFTSVIINAALGIFALFAGDFDELQGKILLTSLSVSAASVLSLAMFPAKERGLLGPVPTVGVALSVLGFGLLVGLVWTEFREETLGRLSGSVLTFAVSAGYASLITLAVVQPKFFNVVRSAYVLVSVLSVLIAGSIWLEPGGDFMLRVMGVLSILLAAATVSIPVLHRLNRDAFSSAGRIPVARQPERCVRCGATEISTIDGNTYSCGACQTRFHAEILL